MKLAALISDEWYMSHQTLRHQSDESTNINISFIRCGRQPAPTPSGENSFREMGWGFNEGFSASAVQTFWALLNFLLQETVHIPRLYSLDTSITL